MRFDRTSAGSMRRRHVAALLVCTLAGCSTLPAEESAAFRKIASASDVQFGSIIESERVAVTDMAISGVADGRGQLVPSEKDCDPLSAAPCTLTYQEQGVPISLELKAPQMRALVHAISVYAAHMAELGEAKDIDEVVGQAAAAKKGVDALASVVGLGALPGAVFDVATLAYKERLVRRRLALMRQVATYAKPAVDGAAVKMGRIAGLVRDNIQTAAKRTIRLGGADLDDGATDSAIVRARVEKLRELSARSAWARRELAMIADRQATLRDQRAARAAEMVRAYQGSAAAAQLNTDFQPLADAHDELIKKLNDPKVSIEEALANIDKFKALVDAFAAAGKS